MDIHAYNFDSLAEKEWKYPKIDEDARGTQLLIKAAGGKLCKDEIDRIAESRVITKKETMTYTYYQNNVKPKPETEGKKGYVCKVCGYVYEGDELLEDFVCPLCKHGAADFEPIE